jgi:hypothetical protein
MMRYTSDYDFSTLKAVLESGQNVKQYCKSNGLVYSRILHRCNRDKRRLYRSESIDCNSIAPDQTPQQLLNAIAAYEAANVKAAPIPRPITASNEATPSRAMIAAMALQGLLTHTWTDWDRPIKRSVELADALLSELQKPKQ